MLSDIITTAQMISIRSHCHYTQYSILSQINNQDIFSNLYLMISADPCHRKLQFNHLHNYVFFACTKLLANGQNSVHRIS